MSDRRISKERNDDNQPSLPDLHVFYKDGVREISGSVVSRNNNTRFLYAIGSLIAGAVTAVALAVAGYPMYAVSVGVVLLITGALVAIVRNNAETSEEPADEPPES